ncbi:hypothetical protein, conserved [Eimeria maxima]|uniref:Uncharacterized protein n=1 Tax=Eimeria maxima TaxID=5804 RepID=U6MHM0_EIMMA|nr:hypothetical protein, conserved [Eimeria maxima]CDJ61969.1 hypothetical protein, conserved [Eimeria maxima]
MCGPTDPIHQPRVKSLGFLGGQEQGARLQKVASEFVLWGYLCCAGRWDPELSSSGPSSPASPFDRVVAGDFGGEPSSAVFQFPNVGGPSQEDSADDANASSHTQSQGTPKIPGAEEDQDGSSPGRKDSDTPSGEKIPEQIQASSGVVSSWQHDSRRRPLVQPEDIWLPRVELSDGHEESGTVTAGERKHKGGGGELVRSSSFARPSRGTDGGQEDTDSKDADASGRPRTSSAGKGHVQTWLGDRHASLRYSFKGVKDKMAKKKLEEAVDAARKMCIPAKRLRTETIQFEHGGVQVEITVTELIGFNWESAWLVKQVGTQLEKAYLSALEKVESHGSGKPDPFAGASCAAPFYAVLLWGIADILDFGNWSTMRTFSVTHERGGRVDGQLAVSVTGRFQVKEGLSVLERRFDFYRRIRHLLLVKRGIEASVWGTFLFSATHVQPLPLEFLSLRRGARLQESSRARSEVDVSRGGALPAPRQTKSEGVSSPGSTGSSDDDS